VDGLCHALPVALGHKLAATVEAPRHTSLPRLLEGAVDAFVRWERAKSSAVVVQLRQLLGHGRAVAGVEGTLEALARRQVATLVMSKAFVPQAASICPACGYLGPRTGSTRCPRCGAGRAVRDTRETLLALAERQGSDVELVDLHPLLHRLGRVGAILRYPWSDARLGLAS
jgi:peptide subunit release factor 1 (eRF1)